MKKFVLSVILPVMCFVGCSSIYAAAPEDSISPTSGLVLSYSPDTTKSIVTINGVPGDSYSLSFKIHNTYSHDSTYQIFPSDIVTQIGGDWGYWSSPEKNHSVGTWYNNQDASSKTIKAGETQSYSTTLVVPQNIKPGEYISGVVLDEKINVSNNDKLPSDGKTASFGANIIEIKKVIHVVLDYNITTATHSLSLSDPDVYLDDFNSNREFDDHTGLMQIDLGFINNGTVREAPKGTILLKKTGVDTPIIQTSYAMKDVYGDTTGIYRLIPPNGLLDSGHYILSYTADYQDQHLEKTYEFDISRSEAKTNLNSVGNTNKVVVNEVSGYWIWIASSLVLLILVLLFFLIRSKKKQDNSIEKSIIVE